MAITSTAFGSNLDIDALVTKLMAVEKKPLTSLATKEATYQAKISALGSLKGAISGLQGAALAMMPSTGATATEKFTVLKATVADTNIASVTAGSTAVPGTYKLEVTQLAQQHRIATATGGGSPFDANNKLIGSGGTLTITLDTAGENTPTKTTSVAIADASTPEEIRDAINAAKAGVSATVVNGASGKQLVLVSDTPGSDQEITLSGVDGLSYDGDGSGTDEFTQLQAAQGSKFKLDGIEITATSNTVTSAIDGLTLTLNKKSEEDVATAITVTRDNSSLTSAVNSFVKAYNDFNTTAASLGSYNKLTKVAGTLNGDSGLRTSQNVLRIASSGVPSELANASLQRLTDIGVTIQKDGSMAVDSSKLEKAIGKDLTGVANLVAAYGKAFNTAAEGLIGKQGSLVARTEGYNTSIKNLGKQAEAIQVRLTAIEARYRKQFTSLDVLISKMTQTSDYLTKQLANLPKLTTSSN